MNSRTSVRSIVFILTLLGAVIFGLYESLRLINKSKSYIKAETEYVENSFLVKRLLNPLTKSDRRASQLSIEKYTHEKAMQKSAIRLGLFLSFVIVLSIVLFIIKLLSRNQLAISIIGISLVCLVAGLFTPLIEIFAYLTDFKINLIIKQKVIYGDSFLYYQNKSIWGVIKFLLREGNIIVGVSIFLFSVIIPFIKVILGIITMANYRKNSAKIREIIHRIGKWSMADVFVTAIFLSFLGLNSMNVGVDTTTKAGIGFYFFLAYCMLSMISFEFIKYSKKQIEVK